MSEMDEKERAEITKELYDLCKILRYFVWRTKLPLENKFRAGAESFLYDFDGLLEQHIGDIEEFEKYDEGMAK